MSTIFVIVGAGGVAFGVGVGEEARKAFADGFGLTGVLEKVHLCPQLKNEHREKFQARKNIKKLKMIKR